MTRDEGNAQHAHEVLDSLDVVSPRDGSFRWQRLVPGIRREYNRNEGHVR